MPSVPMSAATVDDATDEVRPGIRFGPSNDPHEIGEEIGVGISARVFGCLRLSTGEQLAVKVIDLRKWQLLGDLEGHIEKLDQEVQILRALRHERVVNLRMVHRTVNRYFLVMERCGGELFNQIVQTKGLSEVESRYVFRQLLEGVHYMHSKNVIHRDLKPENILIVNSQPIGPEETGFFHDVKIADFGLSKVVSEATSLAKTLVGTPQYYAPEVINCHFGGGTYDKAADLWGLGAVLFVMLCGRYPFDGKSAPLENQIRAAAFNMNTKRWKNISEAAKDLVRGLLRVEPTERLRLEQCLDHPWLTGREFPSAAKLHDGAVVDSTTGLTSVLEEAPCKATSAIIEPSRGYSHNSGASKTSDGNACIDDRAPSKNSDVIDATTPLPSGSSSNVDGEDGPDVEAEFLLLSRRWLAAACRCWRRSLWMKLFTVSALVAVFAGYVFPGRSRHADNLEVLPRPPVHIELFPTVPILPPKTGGGSLPSHAPNVSPRCPAHPGDGALLEGCASHPPPHPGERPPPGIAHSQMGHSMPQAPHPQMGQSSQGHQGTNISEIHEQETIFRLSELLKLQVSIAGSLEMARLAFRHADVELAEITRQTSSQAQTLFQDAANVVSRYAQVAQQVSNFVLPDLQLAVQEREPKLASSLLSMVKDWVTEMKEEGDRTQQRYGQLQSSVLNLVRRAQDTKLGADQRLFEAVRAVEKEPSLSHRIEVCNPEGGADAVAKGHSKAGSGGTTDLGSALKAGHVDMPPSLNSWTEKLFEQLNELTTGGSKKSSWDTSGEVPTVGVSDDDATWRRDLVDLLFMAPGVAPSSLPKVEPFNFKADLKDDEVPSYSDDVHVEDDSGESSGSPPRSDPGSAVVRYVQSESVKSEAESATHSATALLRALRELKRVDQILHGCSAFWANMDGTVQRLAQMKEHTESLINFASKSARLRDRFEQRLGEYKSFWASLERLCRQYCMDHQAAAGRMHEFIRDMTDAANLIDTAESARAGILLAKREKQLATRYSMDVDVKVQPQ